MDREKTEDTENVFDNLSLFDSEKEFSHALSDFLFTSKGLIYQGDFQFEEDLKCGQPAPKIKVRSRGIAGKLKLRVKKIKIKSK